MLVASYQVQIPRASSPFGGNRGVSWVLDNWRISGISTFGTGGHGNIGTITYSPSFDFHGGGENCGLYKVVDEVELPRGDRSIDRWFDTSAIAPLSGRGDYNTDCREWKFALPGWHNHDLTLFKDIRLKEISSCSTAGKSITCSIRCSSRRLIQRLRSIRTQARRRTRNSERSRRLATSGAL